MKYALPFLLICIMLTFLMTAGAKRNLIEVPLIILTGESNSGGYAPNADASVDELAERSVVQILNTSTLLFENLNIGTNNNLDHAALDSTRHGIELELANAVAAGRFFQSQLHIVQTGQGSSNIEEWNVGAPSGFWTKWLQRVNAAKDIYHDRGWKPVPVVFYSQALNDAVGNGFYGGTATTDAAAWKTKTIAHLAKIRAELGAETLIVLTKFKSTYSAFNTAIDEIVAADEFSRVIQTPDNSGVEWQPDTYHWTYLGYKTLCQLFIDEILAANGQTAAPTISPPAGDYSGLTDITITGSGQLSYSTNGIDPFIGSPFSSTFSISPVITVRARAVEQGKKSGYAQAAYI